MKDQYFTSNGHLNDEAKAMAADALNHSDLAKLPREIIDHLEDCQQCQLAISEIEEISNLGEESIPFSNDNKFTIRPQPTAFSPWIWRVAAMILALVSIGAILYLINPSSNDLISSTEEEDKMKGIGKEEGLPDSAKLLPIESVKHTDVLPESEKDYLAANEIPIQKYEMLMQEVVRTDNLKVVAPANDALLSGEISFTWTGGPANVILRIVNNQDQEMISTSARNNHFVLPKKMAPGLYYWFLETADDLLFIGKFRIE